MGWDNYDQAGGRRGAFILFLGNVEMIPARGRWRRMEGGREAERE